ncbi:hypothetical protein MBLNU13_g08910t2 [Cladosporium sp. NU13]
MDGVDVNSGGEGHNEQDGREDGEGKAATATAVIVPHVLAAISETAPCAIRSKSGHRLGLLGCLPPELRDEIYTLLFRQVPLGKISRSVCMDLARLPKALQQTEFEWPILDTSDGRRHFDFVTSWFFEDNTPRLNNVANNLVLRDEGNTGVIELKAALESTPDLEDDDPRSVKLMIDYLYLHDYDPRTTKAPVSVSIDEDCKDEASTSGAPELDIETTIDEPPQPNDASDFWGLGSSGKKGKKEKKRTKKAATWEPEPEPEPEPVPESVFQYHHLPTVSADAALSAVQGPPSFLEMHAKVFALASKYDIRSLEYEARKKFKDETQRSWETIDLIAAIHVLFNLTPDSETELRSILKATMVRHALTLVQHPNFEDAVASIDGLGYGLFRRKTYTRR